MCYEGSPCPDAGVPHHEVAPFPRPYWLERPGKRPAWSEGWLGKRSQPLSPQAIAYILADAQQRLDACEVAYEVSPHDKRAMPAHPDTLIERLCLTILRDGKMSK